MTFDRRVFTKPIVTEATSSPAGKLAAQEGPAAVEFSAEDREAAEVLIRHLFAPSNHRIDGIEYHVAYALADGAVGGDIVDVYHFDNGNVSLAIADISGKGAAAAIHAALVKYGLRCYVSEGLTAERVVRSLDRAYIENNAFERTESFASLFIAIVDQDRRSLSYASAGHEPVMLYRPNGTIEVLPPTAPLIGVFDDQHHLFKQRHVELEAGDILIMTTDGVTEARSSDGGIFGIDRLVSASLRAARGASSMEAVIDGILAEVQTFCAGRLQDDIAALAVRIF